MGQGNSMDNDPKLKAVVNKLSKLEVEDIEKVFMELSMKTQEGESVIKQPTWLNRSKFAELFGTTELVVEQLFEAFDRDKNGLIDMDEFITGMALVLHGGVREKCKLLFKIFNLDGDDGISPDELTTILTSCLESTRTLLLSTLKSEGITGYDFRSLDQTGNAVVVSVVVNKIVKDAFEKCDVSRTGKLEIDEFVKWVHKNPKLMSNMFMLHCPKPSSSSPSQSLSSSVSSFSIVDTPVTEMEPDVFSNFAKSEPALDSTRDEGVSPETTPPTLLRMASTADHSKQSLQHIFAQPNCSSDEENFFDSLSTNTDKLNDKDQKEALPRTQSQIFSAQPFTSNMDVMGGSETNINELPLNKNLHVLPHGTTSGSLQSIALSRDDVREGMDQPPPCDATISTDNSEVNPDSTTEDNDSIWDPLQGHEDNNADSSIEISLDILQNTEQDTVETNLDLSEPIAEPMAESAPSETIKNEELAVDVPHNAETTLNFPLVGTPPLSESVSDVKNNFSFWQPIPRTQQQLNLLEHGQPIEASMLTYPAVLVEGFMGDPVKDLVAKYLGEQEASKRPTLNPENVEISESGLKQLLASGCWRAAIDVTTKYLTAYGQGMVSVVTKERTLLTPSLMQIWFVRIALLVKLRMFSSAEAELNAFNDFDSPDMYYQFYPELYPGKKGSIVPFSFRLLHAELPQHNGRPNVALDRLYQLLNKVTLVINNLSNGFNESGEKINDDVVKADNEERLVIWKKRNLRIHYSLGNCFFGMKEYTLAVKIFNKVIELDPDRKAAILSGIGRIYVQFGDLKTSLKYFEQVDEYSNGDVETTCMAAMNRGYQSLAKSSYEDAYQQFSTVIKLQPENIAACNNASVCLLFLGKVKESSNILESMVMRSPAKALHEDILFNLNTIYELETSRALQKKHKLLDLVNKHRGDGFNAQALKLT